VLICAGVVVDLRWLGDVVMVNWPKHNESIREDELYLFGYCLFKWPNSPYQTRSESAYSDVTSQLNERFKSKFGTYLAGGVRRYIQLCSSDSNYMWKAKNQKRFHHFKEMVEGNTDRTHHGWR
jgi:hypothetical protein